MSDTSPSEGSTFGAANRHISFFLFAPMQKKGTREHHHHSIRHVVGLFGANPNTWARDWCCLYFFSSSSFVFLPAVSVSLSFSLSG